MEPGNKLAKGQVAEMPEVILTEYGLSSLLPTAPGVTAGTVVVTDKAFNAFLQQEHQTVSDSDSCMNRDISLLCFRVN